MITAPSLLLVGCGSMGSALLHGWLNQSPVPFSHIAVLDPAPKHLPKSELVTSYNSLEQLPQSTQPGLILFAVKPQQMADVASAHAARFAKTSPLILSIAAGKTIEFFCTYFGKDARVIRAMPNTPALIGEGASVFAASASCSPQDRALAAKLLSAVGQIYELADESLLDAVTAISGSGPAYVFYFMECLAQAGVQAGLPPALAEALAAQTVRGSALLQAAGRESFAQLRQQVTSPGGTTEAALRVLTSSAGLAPLLEQAVKAALKRAKEL